MFLTSRDRAFFLQRRHGFRMLNHRDEVLRQGSRPTRHQTMAPLVHPRQRGKLVHKVASANSNPDAILKFGN
jgi:hypothetical protein